MRETVYALVRGIPRGKVSTYAAIARKAGTSARAVGSILHANRDPSVPCHRVVRSDGSVGGYNRGMEQKIRILEDEGVLVRNGKIPQNRVFTPGSLNSYEGIDFPQGKSGEPIKSKSA